MNKLLFLVFFLLILCLFMSNTYRRNMEQQIISDSQELFFGREIKRKSNPVSLTKYQEQAAATATTPNRKEKKKTGLSDKIYFKQTNYIFPQISPSLHSKPRRNLSYQNVDIDLHVSKIPYYPVSPPTTVVVNPEYSPSIIPVERLYSQQGQGQTQIGTISNLQDQLIMPLYRKPSPTHKDRYIYYTITNGSNGIQPLILPVYKNERNCMENIGCQELYDNDLLFIPQYNRFFKVDVFPTN